MCVCGGGGGGGGGGRERENGPERRLFRLTLMTENNISIFSCGGHFVQRSTTSLPNFVESYERNISVKF